MIVSEGIFILETMGEFRVAHGISHDSFFGPFNDATKRFNPNLVTINETFFDAPMFASYAEAFAYARSISELDENKDLEYGICVITNFRMLTWEELIPTLDKPA